MSKERVVISRRWKNPSVTVYVNTDEIGARMDIDEYIDSLADQISNISLILTKEQLARKLKDAHVLVAEEMKTSTKYIV